MFNERVALAYVHSQMLETPDAELALMDAARRWCVDEADHERLIDALFGVAFGV